MRLPMEIIVMVASQLCHQSMLSLALTAKRVHTALKGRLNTERAIRQDYRHIDIQSKFTNSFAYHKFLNLLLNDDRLAEYVLTLHCGEDLHAYDRESGSSQRVGHNLYTGPMEFDAHSERLLEMKIARTIWLSEQQCQGILERILVIGCESAVLTVLLCILVQLRVIRPPTPWGDDVEELVQNLSVNHTDSVETQTPPGQINTVVAPRPLSKLQDFLGNTDNGVDGLDLEQASVWMGLPGLQRVILEKCRTDYIEASTASSRSWTRSPDIYLPNSSVTRDAIAQFAKSLRPPCMIRQIWGYGDGFYHRGPPTWDHCEVFESSDGTKQVNTEFRYIESDRHDGTYRTDQPDDREPDPVIGSPEFKKMSWFEGNGDIGYFTSV